jgi:WD40 repeat protein
LAQFDGHQRAVLAAAILPSGKEAVSAGADGYVRLWNIADESVIAKFKQPRAICSAAIAPQPQLIVVGTHSGDLYLIDLKARQQVRQIQATQSCLHDIAISPDGARIVSCGRHQPARVWNAKTGQGIFQLPPVEHLESWKVAISNNSKILAAGAGSTILLYDIDSGAKLKTSIATDSFTQAMLFSADDQVLLTGGGSFYEGTLGWLPISGLTIELWKLPQPLP